MKTHTECEDKNVLFVPWGNLNSDNAGDVVPNESSKLTFTLILIEAPFTQDAVHFTRRQMQTIKHIGVNNGSVQYIYGWKFFFNSTSVQRHCLWFHWWYSPPRARMWLSKCQTCPVHSRQEQIGVIYTAQLSALKKSEVTQEGIFIGFFFFLFVRTNFSQVPFTQDAVHLTRRQTQTMEHTWSVHTARKQHQKIYTQICAQNRNLRPLWKQVPSALSKCG